MKTDGWLIMVIWNDENEAKRMAILPVVTGTLKNYQGQCDNHGVDVPCSGHGSI